MKNRILTYMAYIDRMLEENSDSTDYNELAKEHLVQLGFFMHERLIHLLVTLTVALLDFATFFILIFTFSIGLLILFALLLCLLVPYIMHYYLLENSVQRMYRQYDEIKKKCT